MRASTFALFLPLPEVLNELLQIIPEVFKDFRYYLEQLIQNFRQWKEQSESASPHYAACVQSSFMALIEAKCWLGWELSRIKKEKESPNEIGRASCRER